MIGIKCIIYIDDILVFGKTLGGHKKNLEETIGIMKKYNLKENTEKIIECKEKIVFLGYEIEFNKIRPTLERSQGIQDYTRPINKKGIQRFLGITNYDRSFIKNLSAYAQPLYKLLDKENKFVWSEEMENSFLKVKDKWKEELEY